MAKPIALALASTCIAVDAIEWCTLYWWKYVCLMANTRGAYWQICQAIIFTGLHATAVLGELGNLLRLIRAIDHNGLSSLLQPLRACTKQ